MAEKVYSINKGINKAIEFRGLKAQYIWWVAGITLGSLALYIGLNLAGVGGFMGIFLVMSLAVFGIGRVYRISRLHGQYGMIKWMARRNVPRVLVSRSRKVFILMRGSYGSGVK